MQFFFSSQDGNVSHGISLALSRWLLKALRPFMAYIEAADLDILLRAFAHRAMFGLLALCVFMCLRQLFTRNRVILPATFFILLAAACADELHQLVSVGRGARVSDVVTDMQGVLFVIILSVLAQAVKKRRVTRAGKDRAAGNTHQT